MPMNRETGKDRWRRIPKDYFKGRDRLQKVRLGVLVGAIVLAMGWIASGIDWKNPTDWKATDGNSQLANHGMLARVHAAWDQKCDACHAPFEPVDGRNLFAPDPSPENRPGDQLCMSCHAAPKHHEAAEPSEVKACAGCHRDHQGRDFSLVRLPDSDCTSCHKDLQTTNKKVAGSRVFAEAITRFDKDHPDFGTFLKGSTLKDLGRLKFNHARHLRPGIVAKLGDTPYTVAQIPLAAERPRYQADGQPTDPVQLNCASCHKLDSSEVQGSSNPAIASATLPSRSPGRYYLPATFENSCRACHVLTFDPAMVDVEAPHGIQPDRVVAFLNRTYDSRTLAEYPAILDVYVPPVRLPGALPVPEKAKKRRDEAVKMALAYLFPQEGATGADPSGNRSSCLECHYDGKAETNGIPNRIEPTKVPEIWLTHARFDHTAHRGVSCQDCHAGASRSETATDVLIPKIDNCLQCHAPAKGRGWFGSSPAPSTGGASFDCTECHRYHSGDHPLQGPSVSDPKFPQTKRTISEFLRGIDGGSSPTKSPHP
jgi:hypothetical protein